MMRLVIVENDMVNWFVGSFLLCSSSL